MKTNICKLGLVVALSLVSITTFAKEASKHSESEGIPLKVKLGTGFATFGLTGIGAATAAPALDFWVDLNSTNSLQFLVGISGTSPFAFGYGTIYRHTCHGDEMQGAHFGLGFDLGTNGTGGGSTFFMDAFPVVGFHFSLGGAVSNIRLSFDGGPMFAITPTFGFMLQPLGALFGASMNYFF